MFAPDAPTGAIEIQLPAAVVKAPPGAADNVYCGINVPPAFTDTVPLTRTVTDSAAVVEALITTVFDAVEI